MFRGYSVLVYIREIPCAVNLWSSTQQTYGESAVCQPHCQLLDIRHWVIHMFQREGESRDEIIAGHCQSILGTEAYEME